MLFCPLNNAGKARGGKKTGRDLRKEGLCRRIFSGKE
jgi:hypothetical protein